MAQGRFLSSSVAEDERLNGLSIEAQMMYLMAIPHLDRDGLINGNPSVLLGKVCPLRPKLASRMPHIINEWVQSAMVVKYANGEGWVLWFKGFAKNNPLTHYTREKASRFPPPPGYARSEDDKGLIPEPSAVKSESPQPVNDTSDEIPDTSGTLPESSGKNPPHVQARAQAEVRSEVEVEVEVRDQGDAPIQNGVPPPKTTHPRTRSDVASEQSARQMNREYPDVNPKTLTCLTNHVKRIYGFSALIDKPGDNGTEDKMRGEAYRLWVLGFNTDEAMIELRNAWNEHATHFADKRPYKDQLYELAITLVSRVTNDPNLDFALEDTQ